MVGSVPGVKFGIAFAEASGPCLVRSDGNDDGLKALAETNILKIAAGHTFLILFAEAYPINVINNIRNVSDVAAIYCATSNPVQVIVANVGDGRSVKVMEPPSRRCSLAILAAETCPMSLLRSPS